MDFIEKPGSQNIINITYSKGKSYIEKTILNLQKEKEFEPNDHPKFFISVILAISTLNQSFPILYSFVYFFNSSRRKMLLTPAADTGTWFPYPCIQ